MSSEIYKHSVKTSLPISGHYRYKNVFQIIASEKSSGHLDKWLDIEYDTKYHLSQTNDEQEKKYINRLDSYKEHLNFLKNTTIVIEYRN